MFGEYLRRQLAIQIFVYLNHYLERILGIKQRLGNCVTLGYQSAQ